MSDPSGGWHSHEDGTSHGRYYPGSPETWPPPIPGSKPQPDWGPKHPWWPYPPKPDPGPFPVPGDLPFWKRKPKQYPFGPYYPWPWWEDTYDGGQESQPATWNPHLTQVPSGPYGPGNGYEYDPYKDQSVPIPGLYPSSPVDKEKDGRYRPFDEPGGPNRWPIPWGPDYVPGGHPNTQPSTWGGDGYGGIPYDPGYDWNPRIPMEDPGRKPLMPQWTPQPLPLKLPYGPERPPEEPWPERPVRPWLPGWGPLPYPPLPEEEKPIPDIDDWYPFSPPRPLEFDFGPMAGGQQSQPATWGGGMPSGGGPGAGVSRGGSKAKAGKKKKKSWRRRPPKVGKKR